MDTQKLRYGAEVNQTPVRTNYRELQQLTTTAHKSQTFNDRAWQNRVEMCVLIRKHMCTMTTSYYEVCTMSNPHMVALRRLFGWPMCLDDLSLDN